MANGRSFREEMGAGRDASNGRDEFERERRRRARSWNPTERAHRGPENIYKDDRETRGFYEGPRRDRESAVRGERPYGQRGRDAEGRGPSGQMLEAGGHRGKGPRGYTRSDDRIREDVCDRLYDDDMLDASNIDVEVIDGLVTLSGEVENRRAKRLAEDLAADCSGVKDVQNGLRIGS